LLSAARENRYLTFSVLVLVRPMCVYNLVI